MRARRNIVVASLLCFCLAGSGSTARALDIVLNTGTLLSGNPEALASFRRAAQAWEAVISSPVQVNISADLFSDPLSNTIGATNIFTAPVNLPYEPVRQAMSNRASRPGDGILAYLPTSDELTAHIPTLAGATFDNTTIGITRANQKALGLIPDAAHDGGLDGLIGFNDAFTFDYDSRDGITPGYTDFQTAATHEIGHVLGFLSDTDDYDSAPDIEDNATTLDLFRFQTSLLPKTGEEFRRFQRELHPDVEASFTDTVDSYAMSTGASQGDGRQASHWKDDFIFGPRTIFIGDFIGIMDPTLPPGTVEQITAADLRAFELIGWDTVPEPTSMPIVSLLLASVWLYRRPVLSRACST